MSSSGSVDSGLASLAMVARFHQVAADPAQIRHQFGAQGSPFDAISLVRASRHLGLRAKSVRSHWDRLTRIALPTIAQSPAGKFFVLAKVGEGKVLLQDPAQPKPQTLSREEFEESWNGNLILITRRSLLPGMSGEFDISWFLPALVKYRRLFGEVLVASFFIQLFALITPLFFK